MLISEVAFSTEWFMTIPGMLISGGVLLLIIALIMLIASSSKKKKAKDNIPSSLESESFAPSFTSEGQGVSSYEMEENNSYSSSLASAPSFMDAPSVAPVTQTFIPDDVANVPPVEEIKPISNEVVVEENIQNVTPIMPEVVLPDTSVTPQAASTISMPEMIAPSVPPVEESTPSEPVVPEVPYQNDTPTVDTPTPSFSEEVQIPSTEASPAEIPTESLQPEPTPVVDTSMNTNIYGGNPIPKVDTTVDAPRPIYGGADPMEATQSLPKIEVHREPYGGGMDTTTPVIPTPAPAVAPTLEPLPQTDVIPTITPMVSENVNPTPSNVVTPEPIVEAMNPVNVGIPMMNMDEVVPTVNPPKEVPVNSDIESL